MTQNLTPTGDIASILRVARAEIGYHEGKTGRVWNNNQKYSPEVPGLEWSQNQAWCHTFLSWCARKADLAIYYPVTASTDFGATWFKNRKQWSQTPRVGAFGYLGTNGDMYHVFLVVEVHDTYIVTVEGNTNDNGSSQGDGVYRLTRPRNASNIEGYGYPNIPPKAADKPKATRIDIALDQFRAIRKEAKAKKQDKRIQKAKRQIANIKKNWNK